MEITANVLGIETATQYKAADAEYEKQHLVICETEELARINVRQMLKFLEGADVAAEWDIGAVSEVEIFEQKKSCGMSTYWGLDRERLEREGILC